jgi:golgi phosphoprotein 3
MSSSGLQRRRAAHATNHEDDDYTTSPNSALTSPSTAPGTPAIGSFGSDDRNEDSHRIAVDPKDLEDDEYKYMPKLTLMEEVLLLGLKDRQV